MPANSGFQKRYVGMSELDRVSLNHAQYEHPASLNPGCEKPTKFLQAQKELDYCAQVLYHAERSTLAGMS